MSSVLRFTRKTVLVKTFLEKSTKMILINNRDSSRTLERGSARRALVRSPRSGVLGISNIATTDQRGSVRRALVPSPRWLVVVVSAVIMIGAVTAGLLGPVEHSSAATITDLNFQARLLTDTGALVPDGNYHVEFKLYDSAAAGASAQGVCVGDPTDDCEWVETRTTGDLVTVTNGYLYVNLGDVTAFGALDWSQEKWLTMNIGGTSGPTWDGEMSPRIKLTAVPFAYSSEQLDGLDSTDFVQIAQTEQAVNTASTLIAIDQAGAGDIIDLQVSDSQVLGLTNAGNLTAAGTGTFTGASVSVGSTTQAGTLILNEDTNNNIVTIGTGTQSVGNFTVTFPELDQADVFCLVNENNCFNSNAFVQNGNNFGATAVLGTNDAFGLTLEVGGISAVTIADGGATTFKNETDSTSGFIVADADGGDPVFNVDTTNERIGIGVAVPSVDLEFGESADRVLGVETRASNAAGRGLTLSAGDAGAGGSAFAGGSLTLQGGDAAGTGNANGGNVVLQGGAGVGTGVEGLVVIDTPTVSTVTNATCGTSCTITQANIDGYSGIIVEATAASLEIIMPDPTITTAGRLIYVTAADGSNDFTLTLNNGEASEVNIGLRDNETATLIWNGSDWTAAGASSSTTLQSAYNSTLTSAGGAEIVLNAPGGSADGFTIRNNATTPITGGILEVQSSIGTNLFSVNNQGTELAANGGSETSATWSTDWTTVGSSTVVRTTTSGEYVTGQAAADITTTAAANDGIRNNLVSNPPVSTTFTVSFTAKLDSGTFTTLEVIYSRDGGSNEENCATYSSQTLVTTGWTKITCTMTSNATTATDPDLIIRQTDATARTFWIDNLSFQQNDATTEPSNVQIGGGIDGGPITLFTLDRASAPPVTDGNQTFLGSMYYDTVTGRIQCYEADGWGACGSPPNNIVTITPEYSGSVLNGTGIGTMTADFCADESGVLQINATVCASGEAVNYYVWTSPQATSQTYSIYLTFQLPSTFDSFISNNTVSLDAYTTDTTDATVTYEVFRSTGTAITECGSATTVTTSNDTWQTVLHSGDEKTGCSFAANDRVIFKLNMTAKNNDSVYVSDINFTYVNE